MLDAPSAAFTDFDSWHPSGWSPVYDQVTSRRHLVGFTTLQCGLDRLMIGQETATLSSTWSESRRQINALLSTLCQRREA